MTALFRDRVHAGEELARRIDLTRARDPVVLGLPRGGVPLAGVVAETFGLPLDILVVRKLGAPGRPEYAVGAIGEGEVRVVDEEATRMLGIGRAELAGVEEAERVELARRTERFRRGRRRPDLRGRTAIIVDDGIATGSTMSAACRVARRLGAGEVIAAAPVSSREAVTMLRPHADGVVVLATPEPFGAVGRFYDDFAQTSDGEVVEWLDRLDRGDGARRQ